MKSVSDTRKPYRGTKRALVIALDVGTTFSGVSYAILESGQVPKIYGVTRFPGQEHVAGNSKIPTVIYYDRRGRVRAAGAEADVASIVDKAEDEGWTKVELFKLRLRPRSMKLEMNGMRFSALPKGMTATDVLGDFLGYLFTCTRRFIEDTHANGQTLWTRLAPDIQFVLSHPNGWEGAQQTKMRRAAVRGGLIPDTDEGRARIKFVTEGEASLHACVLNGLAADVLSNPSCPGFVVCDAGGGTLDISSYAIRGTDPLVIEEIAAPDCIFAGSVFVSRRARAFLEEKLQGSRYGTPDSLDHIAKRFDETTKRLFRSRTEPQYIPFGSPLDKDPKVDVRGGQLKLSGAEVADLFEPSVQAAVDSIQAQIAGSKGVVKSVWLVGGFAASPWLFAQLQERLAAMGVTVSRPDSQTSKAVADGAVGFYCDHHVSARVSKFMYGVEFLREFDANDAEHHQRRDRLCELPSGPKLLLDAFDCILTSNRKVKEMEVFSRKYCTELTSLSTLSVFEVEVWCYRGGDAVPKWILRDSETFSTLCMVRADLSPLNASAQAKQGPGGKTFWNIVFSIEIHFGLTEFRARIKWVDNGETKYGPASIVYSESGLRADEDEPDLLDDDVGTPVGRPATLAPSHSSSPRIQARSMSRSGSDAPVPFPAEAIRPHSTISDMYAPASPKDVPRSRQPSSGSDRPSQLPPQDANIGLGRSRAGSNAQPVSRSISQSGTAPVVATSRTPSRGPEPTAPPPMSRTGSYQSSRDAPPPAAASPTRSNISRSPSVHPDPSVHGGTPRSMSRSGSAYGDRGIPSSLSRGASVHGEPPAAPAMSRTASGSTHVDAPPAAGVSWSGSNAAEKTAPSVISRASSARSNSGVSASGGGWSGDAAKASAAPGIVSRSGSARSGVSDVLNATWGKTTPTPRSKENEWAKLSTSTAGTPKAETPAGSGWGGSGAAFFENALQAEQDRQAEEEAQAAAAAAPAQAEADAEAERQAEEERLAAEAAEKKAEEERLAAEKAEREKKAAEEKAVKAPKKLSPKERREAEKKASEEARQKTMEEERKRAEEKREADARRKEEEDRRLEEELAKQQADEEAEAQRKAEEEARLAEEAKWKAEEEEKKKAETETKRSSGLFGGWGGGAKSSFGSFGGGLSRAMTPLDDITSPKGTPGPTSFLSNFGSGFGFNMGGSNAVTPNATGLMDSLGGLLGQEASKPATPQEVAESEAQLVASSHDPSNDVPGGFGDDWMQPKSTTADNDGGDDWFSSNAGPAKGKKGKKGKKDSVPATPITEAPPKEETAEDTFTQPEPEPAAAPQDTWDDGFGGKKGKKGKKAGKGADSLFDSWGDGGGGGDEGNKAAPLDDLTDVLNTGDNAQNPSALDAWGDTGGDTGAAGNGWPEETTNPAADDWGTTGGAKKGKKGKKGQQNDEPPAAPAAPEAGEEGAGDLLDDLADMLGDDNGGENTGENGEGGGETANADDWAMEAKGKKGKKGKVAATGAISAQASTATETAGGGNDGAKGKKKKKK